MKLAIACDHTALELKSALSEYARELGHEITDLGAYTGESGDDYPVYGEKLAVSVRDGLYELGILICGTGIGMALSAGQVRGVRCVTCSDCYTARLARNHNNANVLCLGARVLGPELAKLIMKNFLEAEFEGGRHARRVAMYDDIYERNK